MAEEVDKETQEIFKKYDLDDSKFLELNEIRILLKDISSEADVPCPADKEINQIFKDYDLAEVYNYKFVHSLQSHNYYSL